jgi:hypothetical protein
MTLYTKSRIACGVAAFISFLFSIYLWFTGNRDAGIFVGLWVPSILASGNLILPTVRGTP